MLEVGRKGWGEESNGGRRVWSGLRSLEEGGENILYCTPIVTFKLKNNNSTIRQSCLAVEWLK